MNPQKLVSRYETYLRASKAARTAEGRAKFAAERLRAWPDPASVSVEQIQAFLGRDTSAWTRATYHGHLKSFFGWLHESGAIDHNPMATVVRPKTPQGIPKPLSKSEMDRVLALADGRVRAWVLLAARAGLRAHEIAKLRGEDVQEDYLYVRGKGSKDAGIPTHPEIWTLAQRYPRQGYWFTSARNETGHIKADSVTIGTARLFRDAGIPHGSIHRVRHCFATNLLRQGTSIRVVQELMRHSDISTTALYCAVDEDEMRAAVNLLSA
jgi:integrase/recombinase XerD